MQEVVTDLMYCLKKAKYRIKDIESANYSNYQHSDNRNLFEGSVSKRDITYLLALSMYTELRTHQSTSELKQTIKLYGIKLGGFKKALNCCDDCLQQLRQHGFLYVLDKWEDSKRQELNTNQSTNINLQ